MEYEQAPAILKTLAEGIDPATGARFTARTPWRRAAERTAPCASGARA